MNDREHRTWMSILAAWLAGELDLPEEGPEDPADSLAAGRPESLAPSPEEVLTREPGSSAEV